ncbi:hypothetical protein PTTG_27280 [Puccinia triticina 1-1 BBBD Race 1]|uniref:Helicase ATP-binding domain-containing protein n=1 Tax=Puccinia triticina (isolate 1-1 / race 1 (BBBD)) TaxID=630390 RepID=A0A180GMC2_PUCT1|nr:hypothetical protein PTTG_27280 [Puccinia triticina 1-1 BBBD Race 1]
MSNVLCLGQFIIPLHPNSSFPFTELPQQAFLQRGRNRVHVWSAPRLQFGDLSQLESEFLGPLLGPIRSCSTPITKTGIENNEPSTIKLRAFLFRRNRAAPQLRGCVFSLAQNKQLVLTAFRHVQVDLSPIWNYQPSVFFNIPHTVSRNQPTPDLENNQSFQTTLQGCQTTLKDHQLTALQFLEMNESTDENRISNLWNHPGNHWIRQTCDKKNLTLQENETFTCRGSILADDMGLGKTLTTLAFVLSTSEAARSFQTRNIEHQSVQSAATLVICLLATLSNWKNEIGIHFNKGAIPYQVFHGRDRGEITREALVSSLVVLTTYEMVGPTGNPLHTNQITIELLDICWLRIVLDKAHMIRNPTANQTVNIQKLKTKFCLCLTGTPMQNRLTDLQSLITLLKISPWDKEWIWKQHLIPGVKLVQGTQLRL